MAFAIETAEPALTVKVEFALMFMPAPANTQLPDVVAEPKVSPARF
jgi:hypothetical protein